MIDTIKRYTSKRLNLLKMEAIEKSSLGIGSIVFIIMMVFTFLFFLILFNIGLGLWIGSLLGNYGYGVLIVASFYLLVLIILLLAKNSIKNSVANKIIKSLNK